MWATYVVQVLLGLFACFGGSGKNKGKNCHCMAYCDITTPEDGENSNHSNEPADTTEENQ